MERATYNLWIRSEQMAEQLISERRMEEWVRLDDVVDLLLQMREGKENKDLREATARVHGLRVMQVTL